MPTPPGNHRSLAGSTKLKSPASTVHATSLCNSVAKLSKLSARGGGARNLHQIDCRDVEPDRQSANTHNRNPAGHQHIQSDRVELCNKFRAHNDDEPACLRDAQKRRRCARGGKSTATPPRRHRLREPPGPSQCRSCGSTARSARACGAETSAAMKSIPVQWLLRPVLRRQAPLCARHRQAGEQNQGTCSGERCARGAHFDHSDWHSRS